MVWNTQLHHCYMGLKPATVLLQWPDTNHSIAILFWIRQSHQCYTVTLSEIHTHLTLVWNTITLLLHWSETESYHCYIVMKQSHIFVTLVLSTNNIIVTLDIGYTLKRTLPPALCRSKMRIHLRRPKIIKIGTDIIYSSPQQIVTSPWQWSEAHTSIVAFVCNRQSHNSLELEMTFTESKHNQSNYWLTYQPGITRTGQKYINKILIQMLLLKRL